MASQVKFEKIVSCSSEDPAFPAKNLLTSGEVPGSWLTGSEGESQGTVVIQLDRKYKINHLEIKNESSAFIEILVANTDDEEPKFQVLLSASSFMTPNESKNLLNINRCRVFTKDKLSPSALKQFFDLVKINCTQPFNKNIKYGVSCIKLTEGDNVDQDVSSSQVNLVQTPRVRTQIIVDTTKVNDNESPSPSPSPSIKASDPPQSDDSEPSPNKRIKQVTVKDMDTKPSTSKPEEKNEVKPKSKIRKPQVDVPFNQLMNGVTFTISGFQNPLRSEIRSKGLQMGAKYRGDWDAQCTHLICAFPNTPKFNQVQATGTGKIITKEWIEDSFDKRKLLPWRKYNLDDQQKKQSPKKPKNTTDRKKKRKESDSEDDDSDDSEMDDFIVDDNSDDEIENDKDYENENEDDEIDELGPVLPSKLRDNSPNRLVTPSPEKKKKGDAIYDAATDDED